GCDWTDVHVKQGFARRPSTVSFSTILGFGTGSVKVYLGPYRERESYERVIAVPFFSPSGRVVVEGPEEYPAPLDQRLILQPGHYKLFAAQQVVDEDKELIDLYFHRLDEPAENSEILVADDELDPPEILLEEAEIAEV
ncbi:MAG: competence protein ComJ, partial [Blastocatellia bacterium]